MDLLSHFDQEQNVFFVLKLKDSERDLFIAKLPAAYLQSYIHEQDLLNRITLLGSTKESELAEILPSEGNIKSGDFGEILSYYIFKDRHKAHPVNGPKKWRWKQEKNVAAPYTDVILYSIKNLKKPSKDDLLISVESKMKAVRNNRYHPIEKAIEGAEKDFVSRIANSLNWIKKKYKDELLKKGAPIDELKRLIAELDRFIKSETTGEYTKQVNAIAYVDKTLLAEETAKTVTLPSLNGTKFEVFVVSIDRLQAAYEKVFDEIPKL